MSDAVMVPREPTETMARAFRDARPDTAVETEDGGWEAPADDWFRAKYAAMLAASTPVGGWEEPVAWQRRMRNTSSDASDWQSTWSQWTQCTDEQASYARENGHVEHAPEVVAEVRPLYAAPPPPSVSTDNGSRPQEAVPTAQAVPPVVDDLRYEVARDRAYRDGLRAGFRMGEAGDAETYEAVLGNIVSNIVAAAKELTVAVAPQPADGCSSNEGAA